MDKPRTYDLPDTFTLRIKWDMYDRNQAWERVLLGTMDITTQVDKKDVPPWEEIE